MAKSQAKSQLYSSLQSMAQDNFKEQTTNNSENKIHTASKNIHLSGNEEIQNKNDEATIYSTNDYSLLHPYPKDELRLPLHTGEKYRALENAILTLGYNHTPVKCAPASDYTENAYNESKDGFIILGGHNRYEILKRNNLPVRYMVLNGLTVEEMDRIVAEEHILNRQIDELKVSQTVTLLSVMYKEGRSVSNILSDAGNNENINMKDASIYRYLKLRHLDKRFLEWVDVKRLSIRAAVEISKISKECQDKLWNFCDDKGIEAISQKKAEELNSTYTAEFDLTPNALMKILVSHEKISKTLPRKTVITTDSLVSIMPEKDIPDAKNIIMDALKLWYSQKEHTQKGL